MLLIGVVRMESRLRIGLALSFLILVGCQTVEPLKRVPISAHNEVVIEGNYPNFIRAWGDGDEPSIFRGDFSYTAEGFAAQYPEAIGKPLTIMVLSGGGENGAFGAGVLVGWSEKGTRPEFTIVTGVSAGAIIAPFAFLGSQYDDELKSALLGINPDVIVDERSILGALFGDAYTEGNKLLAYIDLVITDAMIDEIAVQHNKGRRLLIGTSNLDASRPVTWDIGAIASSREPNRYQLVRQLIVASASIPGFFPPQFIEVKLNGESFYEMHVDGGVTRELFYDPLKFDYRALHKIMKSKQPGQVYIIRNGRLRPAASITPHKIAAIMSKSMDSLIASQSLGDAYRAYIGAQRDGMGFNLAYVTDEFVDKPDHEMFDAEHMQTLFEHARDKVKESNFWLKSPLYVDPAENGQ